MEFLDYLTRQAESCREEINRLEKEGRKDDADFAKVRANIYEVCRTVTQALGNRPGAGMAAVRARFADFRKVWGGALAQAKEHGDLRNVVVGETKLEALDDVMAHFPEVDA